VAEKIGFNLRGGNRNHNLDTGFNFNGYENELTNYTNLGWTPKKLEEAFYAGRKLLYFCQLHR
jgi:hypothetical protein